ncbi:hypothetical protein [Niallia nealsonii]|uniref:Uncharacterized protein n=1 Tax=Niallia nealsonii TaxID=115979 RepID=A0A2N0Z4Z9_9BACI|nr:hypothetical protein [Niallia nealsonii]PKG24601.1 hypothetical protein CWS01_04885 [Niallia nealsonii]
MHAISIASIYLLKKITILLPKLQEIIEKDKSTIVRDYANVGQAGSHAVFSILKNLCILGKTSIG